MRSWLAAPGLVAFCALAFPSVFFAGNLVLCVTGGTGAALWSSEAATQLLLDLAQAPPSDFYLIFIAFLLDLQRESYVLAPATSDVLCCVKCSNVTACVFFLHKLAGIFVA